MNLAVRWTIGLAVCVWMQAAWCAEAIPGTYEECIEDPIFDGKVCTVQANREAKIGVILIHGLGGSVDDWKNTIPALATCTVPAMSKPAANAKTGCTYPDATSTEPPG